MIGRGGSVASHKIFADLDLGPESGCAAWWDTGSDDALARRRFSRLGSVRVEVRGRNWRERGRPARRMERGRTSKRSGQAGFIALSGAADPTRRTDESRTEIAGRSPDRTGRSPGKLTVVIEMGRWSGWTGPTTVAGGGFSIDLFCSAVQRDALGRTFSPARPGGTAGSSAGLWR